MGTTGVHPTRFRKRQRMAAEDFPLDPPYDLSMAKYYPLSEDAIRALDALDYISEHLKKDEEYKSVTPSGGHFLQQKDDWKFAGMILDRLMLFLFFGITVGGTCGILFSAPHIFEGSFPFLKCSLSDIDQKAIIDKMLVMYKSGGNIEF